MIQPPLPHPVLRTLNRVGPTLQSWLGYPTLEPEPLLETAVRRARLQDFGDDGFRKGLAVLCASAQREAHLTTVGAVSLAEQIVNALITRLWRVELRRQGLTGSGLNRPLVVVGLPRSGTTFLHRLLALDPTARALRTWEVREPFAPRRLDLRRWRTRGKVWALKLAAPGIDAKHRVDADQPEECVFLLDSSLQSPAFWMMAPVYGYLEWLLAQDPGPAYDAYRELLEHFQRQQPEKRLCLKAPAHTAALDTLLDRVPEVCLVQTHRDPVPIVSSVNSLFLSLHGALADPIDVGRMARANLRLLETSARASMEARPRLPKGAIFDLRYRDLVADPVGAVQRIYDHFGLDFTAAFERLLRQALAVRKQGRFGRHQYRAEDFGMTDAELAERFAFYTARYQQ